MTKRTPGLRFDLGFPSTPGIYKIVCAANDRVYVGSTVSLRGHASHHKYLLANNKEYNPPLQAAYNKYGWEHFELVVLEHVSKNDISKEDIALSTTYPVAAPFAFTLARREQWHMDTFSKNALFNTKPAGPSGTLGIAQSEEQKLKHSRSKGGRPFYATNEISDEILFFEHIGEACTALPDLQRAHIQDCLHDRRFSHGGFVFDFDPTFVPIVAPNPYHGKSLGANHNSRVIIAKNTTTGTETSFDHVNAVKAAGFEASAVYLCLAGKKPAYRDHTWHYADGLPHRTTAQPGRRTGARKHGGSRPIVGTHKETGAAIHFEYVNQAAKALGVAPQNICASIAKKRKNVFHSAGGYFWDYVKKDEPLSGPAS